MLHGVFTQGPGMIIPGGRSLPGTLLDLLDQPGPQHVMVKFQVISPQITSDPATTDSNDTLSTESISYSNLSVSPPQHMTRPLVRRTAQLKFAPNAMPENSKAELKGTTNCPWSLFPLQTRVPLDVNPQACETPATSVDIVRSPNCP